MQRPVSISLFAALFGFATIVSMLLAIYTTRMPHFGLALTPDAARTLTARILTIRLIGIGFALSLMLCVVFGKSSAARWALGMFWLLGLATSVAFLRGIGVITPGGAAGLTAATGLSIIQLCAEGFAILILYGGDASPWFERGFRN